MKKQETVLVTGGASGIGLAVATACLREGWRVIICDRDQANLDRCRTELPFSQEGAVHFEKLDVVDEPAVVGCIERCESEFGPITGLLNSAGIASDTHSLDTSADLFRRILEVNLIGSFIVSREISRRMGERGRGSIVNIASVSGIRGNMGRVAYGASKGGVVTMTKVMAVELAPLGIRVNAVAPGPIETPLVREVHTENVRSEWMRVVPQRRYGTPQEVADAAIFLLDNRRASYVTGQLLCVDGGFTAAGLMNNSKAT